jgi:ClpP class serine protease
VQALIDGFYQNVHRARRAVPPQDARNRSTRIGRGRVWTGAQARDRGLVDALGGLERRRESCEGAGRHSSRRRGGAGVVRATRRSLYEANHRIAPRGRGAEPRRTLERGGRARRRVRWPR